MANDLEWMQSLSTLDEEQRQSLLMIASGAPLGTCLDALTEAVSRLAPGTRACVLLADADGSAMGDGHSAHFAPSFAASVRGMPIGEVLIGTCGSAIYTGQPVACADVEGSTQWSPSWRALCRDNDIRACYSHPAVVAGGKAVGSFFLCLSEAREPNVWERRVAEFGALATGIVVERDRVAARQRDELQALERLQALSAELVGPGEFKPLLNKILAAAADISGTDKGNIQIFDPATGSLRIVVHQGFGPRFVDHFRNDGWDASCGEAARQTQRLVVPDVQELVALRGTPGLEIVLEEQIRSIQCTPLLSRDGRLLGMLNNHYAWPGGPSAHALRYIDLLARQAAELVERHQIEEQLAQERRRKDEFLAMLAHELRNPLAPMRSMLEVQKHADGDPARARTAHDVMERQLLQLVRLVDDLLDVNRINRGKLELRMGPLQLQDAVQQAIEACRPLIDGQGHRLVVDMPEAPIHVDGDLARLTQVFGNLLGNAAKYTPAAGAIGLRATVHGDTVSVVIQDDGVGIPAAELERIFEPFTQVDRSLERSQGGMGVGLMLVRRFVEMHGGTVTAQSSGVGAGSAFTVTLPLTTLRPATPAGPARTGLAPPRRVLVVDDNRDAAASLVLLLQAQGHLARAAVTGEEALHLGPALQPQLVLLDIGMPGMSGYEVCRHIRDTAWGRTARLIALTGWGQAEDRHRSSQAGFDLHWVKPVDPATLKKALLDVGGPSVAAEEAAPPAPRTR